MAGLIDWLGISPSSQTPSGRVCVIPASAPLLSALNPGAVCRIFCALRDIPVTAAQILTHLRTVELPDQFVERSVRHLTLVHRTQTWLAMARLAQVDVVILIEPMDGAPLRHQRLMNRVLQEATAYHRHIFLVTPHPESAAALGAFQTPPIDRLVQ